MPRIRAENIEQHKANTRAAILTAAEDAFAGHDFSSVSLGIVADLAELPRSTLYDYFASKEALIAALIQERVPPIVEEWIKRIPDGGPMVRLEGFFAATFEMAAQHPNLTAAILGAGRQIPRHLHDEFVPVAYNVVDQLRILCREGLQSGDFAETDCDALTSAVTDLLAGGIDDLMGRDRPKIDVDTVTRTRLNLLRRGVQRVA